MIPRRQFLKAVAMGAASLPLVARGASSNDHPPSLGFSLYGMKSLPLAQALETCAETGYSHVEFSLNPGYATDPKTFSPAARQAARQKLLDLKLGLPCLMVLMNLTAEDAAHQHDLEVIRSASRLAYDLDLDQPPILETVVGGSPSQWDLQKTKMADQLHAWAATAEQEKIVIAIKAHVGSAVNSPDRLLWLLDAVKSPAIQVAYDYSHFELQGIGLEESLQALLPRTKFIHVKDTQGDAKKFQFLLPGSGRTDYVQYFSLLRQQNYSGPVCVEVSGQVFSKPDYDPIAAARQCYQSLSTSLEKAYAT